MNGEPIRIIGKKTMLTPIALKISPIKKKIWNAGIQNFCSFSVRGGPFPAPGISFQ